MNIFQGKTVSPIREFIANAIRENKPKRILMPCVGSFAVCFLLSEEERKKTYCSDINLYSSVIGFLASGEEKIAEKLGIEIDTKKTDDIDVLAETMYHLALDQLPCNNQYNINKRKSMQIEKDVLVKEMKDQLSTIHDRLSGIHYDIKDFRQVVEELQEGDFLYVNPPTYRGGYEKMFPYESVKWQQPEIAFFDDKEYANIVNKMFNSPATVLVYSQKQIKIQCENMHVIYAQYMGGGRTDYIVSNKQLSSWSKTENKKVKTAIYPIFNDDEITPDSKITILEVDKDTCLYYRDLFCINLGQPKRRRIILCL